MSILYILISTRLFCALPSAVAFEATGTASPRPVDEILLTLNPFVSTKYVYTTHSELNAILNYRGGSLEGAKIYVDLFPCNECAKEIIQVGIKELYYLEDKYKDTKEVIASKKMLDACGVKYTCLKDKIDV